MKRAENYENTRAALLAAALRLFTAHGFEHVSMEEVAEAAGVSRATAFRYFAAKHDLVLAERVAWGDEFKRLAAETAEGDPFQRLETIARELAMSIESDAETTLGWCRIEQAAPDLRQLAAARHKDWVDVASIIASPLVSPPQARIAGAAIIALLFECFTIWAESDGTIDLVDLVQESLPLLIRGLHPTRS